jgi:thiol-disulfide isomerase/thioredoxin
MDDLDKTICFQTVYPSTHQPIRSSGHWSRRRFALSMAAGIGGIFVSSAMPSSAYAVLDTLKPLTMPSPKTGFLGADGQNTRLADWRGTPLLVNFWATWCPPCIHELPSLMRLDQRLRQQNMAVMLISVDRAGIDKARPFLEKLGIAGTELGFDPRGDLAKAVGIKALPTSFCINADGIMTAQIVGDVEWDQPAVIETILPYLSA